MSKRLMLIVAAVSMLLVVGCAKPPDVEMQAATNALSEAKTSKAETYAADALRQAQEKLDAAMQAKQEQDAKFALFRSYTKVQPMFVEAQQLADAAKQAAIAEEQRQKDEVANLITQAQGVLDQANTALAAAPVGKGNKADIELIKNDLMNLGTTFEDAKATFGTGDYGAAKTKVEAVTQKANEIINEIALAAAKKAGK